MRRLYTILIRKKDGLSTLFPANVENEADFRHKIVLGLIYHLKLKKLCKSLIYKA